MSKQETSIFQTTCIEIETVRIYTKTDVVNFKVWKGMRQQTEFQSLFWVRSQYTMAGDDTNLMWLEKYRPKTFDDVLSQQDIINTSKFMDPKEC